jgi:hypothetical protein
MPDASLSRQVLDLFARIELPTDLYSFFTL